MAGKSKGAVVCMISILFLFGIKNGQAGGYPQKGWQQTGNYQYPTSNFQGQGNFQNVASFQNAASFPTQASFPTDDNNGMIFMDASSGRIMNAQSIFGSSSSSRRQSSKANRDSLGNVLDREIPPGPDEYDVLWGTILLLLATKWIDWVFKET